MPGNCENFKVVARNASLIVIFGVVACVAQSIITVPCCDVADIYSALESAPVDAVVELAPGTFTGCPAQGATVGGTVTLRGNGSVVECREGYGINVTASASNATITIKDVDFTNFTSHLSLPALSLTSRDGCVIVCGCSFINNTGYVLQTLNTITLLSDLHFLNNTIEDSVWDPQTPMISTGGMSNTLSGVHFIHNACPTLYIAGGLVVDINNCSFVGNIQTSDAGAFLQFSTMTLILSNSIILDNQMPFAYFLYFGDGFYQVLISGVTAIGNGFPAGTGNECMAACRGLLLLFPQHAVITDSIFANNAGGLYSVLDVTGYNSTSISRCTFVNNTGQSTIALGVSETTTIWDITLCDNTATNYDLAFTFRPLDLPIIEGLPYGLIKSTGLAIFNTQGGGGALLISNEKAESSSTDTILLAANFSMLAVHNIAGVGVTVQAANVVIADSNISFTKGASIEISDMLGFTATFANVTIENSGPISVSSGVVTIESCHLNLNAIVDYNNGQCGGALSVSGAQAVFVNHSIFTGNTASCGGAIFAQGTGIVHIAESCFSENLSTGFELGGGALYLHNVLNTTIATTLMLSNSIADGGMPLQGGAILAYADPEIRASVVMDECYISHGMTRFNAGAAVSTVGAHVALLRTGIWNGAAPLSITNGTLTIQNSVFGNNRGPVSIHSAGAIINRTSFWGDRGYYSEYMSITHGAGALSFVGSEGNHLQIFDSEFSFFVSTTCGGALNISGDAFVSNCSFISNSALIDGGAIYLRDGTSVIENLVFQNNTADSGGNIFLQSGDLTLDGVSFEGSNDVSFVCASGVLHSQNVSLAFDDSLSTDEIDCKSCGCCFLETLLARTNVSSFGGHPFLPGTSVTVPCMSENVTITCMAVDNGTSYISATPQSVCFPACPENCVACSSASVCLDCEAGFGLTPDSLACIPCDMPCATCSFANICTSCSPGLLLTGPTMCEECETPCATCSGTLDSCTSCGNTFVLYPVNQTCQECPAGCSDCIPCNNCSGVAACLQCQTSYSLQGVACIQLPHIPAPRNHIWIYIGLGIGGGLVAILIASAAVAYCRRRVRRTGYHELGNVSIQDTSGSNNRITPTLIRRANRPAGVTTLTFTGDGSASDSSFSYTLNASEVGLVDFRELTIVERLGAGGQGEVYHVQHTRTFTEMALKTLGHFNSSDALTMALDEIKVLVNLHHPHCLAYLGVCQMEGGLGILTEYMAAGDLAARGSSLSMHQKLRALSHAGKGLAYLHLQDIIHGDIKPSNIFLDDSGKAVLGDFGLAGATQPRGMTPLYAAPEIVDLRLASKASDVYAFGVTCLAVVTDEEPSGALLATSDPRPFAAQTLEKARARLASEAVAHVLDASMARDAAVRPTVEEVVGQLLRLLTVTPSV